MLEKNFEWEEIVVDTSKNGNKGKHNTIWLAVKSAKENDTRYNIINFSSDICEKAKWYNGIRVNLARQGTSLFRFKPSSVGLYTVKLVNAKAKTMRLINMLLAAEFRPDENGTEFDAWVDGDTIYCKPKDK